jgi:DNA-binding response OmpR family regulator
MRVLLVEDDDAIAEPLTAGLARYGFGVSRVRTGAEALAAPPHEVVLLDLGLPDMDGIDICRRLRATSAVPIIVVTARAEEVDRVLGLELGADDYVVKPFGSRRVRPAAGSVESPQRLGRLELDRRQRQVLVDGTEVALTAKEFDLLALLAEDPGAVFTRDQILEQVWDPHWFGPTKTLDVHVASLRKKLGDPAWIETVRGVGFRLVAR